MMHVPPGTAVHADESDIARPGFPSLAVPASPEVPELVFPPQAVRQSNSEIARILPGHMRQSYHCGWLLLGHPRGLAPAPDGARVHGSKARNADSIRPRVSGAVPCRAPIGRDARTIRMTARTIDVAVLAPNRQRFGRGVRPVEYRNGQGRTKRRTSILGAEEPKVYEGVRVGLARVGHVAAKGFSSSGRAGVDGKAAVEVGGRLATTQG
jgi:hypothetical protein